MQFDPSFRPPHGPSKAEQQYRLFFLDELGHFEKAHEFEAEDQYAAIRIWESWREGRSMELGAAFSGALANHMTAAN